ncbi:MAG TPA: valine--tRNA ligase [Myxococcales bacterium]|nr:valine--tRNA ligase [Myxococcales bacterium]
MSLSTRYNPAEIEARRYAWWESSGFFHGDERRDGPTYAISLPPPNVTGSLHMGHALTVAIEDVLIRWKRMSGFNAMWMPGTDHAGIATQMVVERELDRLGEPSRRELGRDRFLEKVWSWKERNGSRIVEQARIMGCSLDWERERFTMDEGFSEAVRHAFIELHKEGLIYRAERLINWSPGLQTSLSDLEVDHVDTEGKLWHLAYPVADSGERLVVATTRPETMLGDTAVAVHPDDPRYAHLIGQWIDLPLTGRRIPIVADPILVDLEFGTGAVKVTPAHDFNDFATGQRHGLEMINILDATAHIELEGPYRGLHVSEARQAVVRDLEAQGFLVKVEDHAHSVGHCQRSGCVVEPRLSMQWFVKTQPLAAAATEATRTGQTQIVPERFEATWYHWMDNIQDWCISRQLWWGHRIPAWYTTDGAVFVAASEAEARVQATAAGFSEDVELQQDEDVLDTWFSSGLWPFGTLGWPEKTQSLERFYPNDVLETGHDILFFWVARMMMMGIHFMGRPPFHTIFLHGMVRDEHGQKMSKTKENVVDPVELTERYGADALRLGLLLMAGPGRDVKLSEQRVEGYRNFLTKVWNATRFTLPYLEEMEPSHRSLAKGPAERWIVSRLAKAQQEVGQALEEYRLDEAGNTVYAFIWHEFCDWYIELSKGRLRDGSDVEKATIAATLVTVLDGALRLLHPFCPFLTEELWQQLPAHCRHKESLSLVEFSVDADRDEEAEAQLAWAQQLIGGIRNLRNQMGIKPRQPLTVQIETETEGVEDVLPLVIDLAALEQVTLVSVGSPRPEGWILLAGEAANVLVNPEGTVDLEAERQRLSSELKKMKSEADRCRQKLSNENFVNRAPPAVVDQERRRLEGYENRQDELSSALARLG